MQSSKGSADASRQFPRYFSMSRTHVIGPMQAASPPWTDASLIVTCDVTSLSLIVLVVARPQTTMSLPTPPHTSQRGAKENRSLRSGSSRVEWASQDQYHPLSSPSRIPEIRRALVDHPTKSILKRTSPIQHSSPLPDSNEREETLEPSSPQSDSHYLQYPISIIINDASTLLELNTAYSTLGSRLRATVDESLNPDSEWPLFQPLREHSDKVMRALTRDVVRARENPISDNDNGDDEIKVSLPSPQKSPRKKKKGGMTANQVRHARDLCTTTHCVLKLLGFVFTQPAICGIFSGGLSGFLPAFLFGL